MIDPKPFNFRVLPVLEFLPPELALVVQKELALSTMVDSIKLAIIAAGQMLERYQFRLKINSQIYHNMFEGELEEVSARIKDSHDLSVLGEYHEREFKKAIRIYYFWALNVRFYYAWDSDIDDRFKALSDCGTFTFDGSGFYSPPSCHEVSFCIGAYLAQLRNDL